MSTPFSKPELRELRHEPEREKPYETSALLSGFYNIFICVTPILLVAIPIYFYLQGWGLYYILWLVCGLCGFKIFRPEAMNALQGSWRSGKVIAIIVCTLMAWPGVMLFPFQVCLAPLFWLIRKMQGKHNARCLGRHYESFYKEVALRAALAHFAVFMVIYEWTAQYRPGASDDVLAINQESPLAFLLFLTPTLWVPAVSNNGVFSATILWWGLSCGVSLIFGLLAGRILAPELYLKRFGEQEQV